LALLLITLSAKALATVASGSHLSTVAQCLPSPARSNAEDVIWTVLRLYVSRNVGILLAFSLASISSSLSSSFLLMSPASAPYSPALFFPHFYFHACKLLALTPCYLDPVAQEADRRFHIPAWSHLGVKTVRGVETSAFPGRSGEKIWLVRANRPEHRRMERGAADAERPCRELPMRRPDDGQGEDVIRLAVFMSYLRMLHSLLPLHPFNSGAMAQVTAATLLSAACLVNPLSN
jgi:hypothetical protein